jgi:xylulokinase
MAALFLGLDFGTGGAKAALMDAEGGVRGYAFEEYASLHPCPGWSEHDPAVYWDATGRLIRQCLAQAGVAAAEIRGLALSSALPSLVLVDDHDQPIGNAYNLMDRRARDEVQRLKVELGEQYLFELTKNRLDDHPAIVNLLWEQRHRPDQFRRVRTTLTIDGYVALKLIGRATAHYSGAAFWGVAYNLLERRFERDILERIGIPPEILPELFPCTAVIGEVTRAAAAATGLAAGTPVAAGQVDCNASWMGAGAIEPGDIQMNLGTCGNFGIIHRDTHFLESMIAFAYTIDSARTYITVPTTTTGGQLIRYMRDTFYRAEKEHCQAAGSDVYEHINLEAEQAPPGSDGLLVLPFLMGERTPLWDPLARGVVFGLSLNHSRGHVVRAMMESVAFALYHSFEIIRSTGRPVRPPIVLNEGGAKSRLWRRIITDVFNVPTAMVERRTGAPYGNAILAGVATGAFPDFQVARQWTRHVEPLEPDPSLHDRYMEYYRLYRQLYEHLQPDFRDLARLRELVPAWNSSVS